MGQLDWGNLSGVLAPGSDALSGPTAGTTPPPGGGTYVFGMKSVQNVVGIVGKYCLQTNFSPTPTGKGGRISGAVRRSAVGAASGFAPFLFFSASGPAASANAYLLGLSDENPSHIELRKGAIADGLPAVVSLDPASSPNILMRSTDTFDAETWQHLRLDVIVQGTGDVILQVYRNDLGAHNVSSPVWQLVPGMEGAHYPTFAGFVDDALGVNTGTSPYSAGGHIGFASRFSTANRATYFDHIAIERQL
jgi:hypothetical protein